MLMDMVTISLPRVNEQTVVFCCVVHIHDTCVMCHMWHCLSVSLAPTSDMLPAKVSQLTNGGLRVEYVSSFVGSYTTSAKVCSRSSQVDWEFVRENICHSYV